MFTYSCRKTGDVERHPSNITGIKPSATLYI